MYSRNIKDRTEHKKQWEQHFNKLWTQQLKKNIILNYVELESQLLLKWVYREHDINCFKH